MPVQILVATRKYSDYILYPNLTETAAQAAMPTKSYGNFGLGQASGQGQAGQVGAAAAAGLVPDPVQVRADHADADV